MSGPKKSIDEIWKELNAAKQKPRQGGAGLAVGLNNLRGITSLVSSKPVKAPPRDEQAANEKTQPDLTSGPYVASAVGDDVAAYLASLQRTINCLADPDRGLRRTAATTLQTKLFTGDASTPKATPVQLQLLLSGPLLRPLVTMLSEFVERCRVVALAILLDGSRQLTDVSPMLPELIPALVRRFGTVPVQEPAEEVRLQITQLTVQLLAAAPPPQLARFAPDLAAVVCRSLEDGYPDIKRAGCVAVEIAATRVPHEAFATEIERLLNSLTPNLQHQHSRVRLSSIQALDALVAAGAAMTLIEDNVVAALRPVGHDRAQPVREAAFTALARWMGYSGTPAAAAAASESSSVLAVAGRPAMSSEASSHLPPQAYVASLLPLLIIGVTDPQPATAQLALQLVEGVGEAWAAAVVADASTCPANGSPASDAAAARVQEFTNAHVGMPSAEDTRAAGDRGAGGDDEHTEATGEECVATANGRADSEAGRAVKAEDMDRTTDSTALSARVAACRLDPPYHGRPAVGCRAMAKALLPQHLPPLVRQLGEWTSGLRVAAARALHTLLVLAEDGVGRHLKMLLPALCSAIADEDLEMASHVMASVHVVGAHVAPADWLPRILDALSPLGTVAAAAPVGSSAGGSISLSQRTNMLVVLSGLLHAAGRAARELPLPLLSRLAAVLAEEPMLAAAGEHAGVRQQLLAAVTNTLGLGGSSCAAVSLPLHVVLLQLYGSDLTAVAAAAAAGTPPSPATAAVTGGGNGGGGGSATAVGSAALEAMASLAASCGYDRNSAATAADGVAFLMDLHSSDLIRLLFGEEEALPSPQRHLLSSLSWRPRAGDASWQCILRATLLTAAPLTLQRLAPALVSALQPLVGDKEREADMRLCLLQLVDSVLEDPLRGRALAAGGGQALIMEVLMPPLIWQAGKTAAAVRYAAVTAMATLLGKRLPLPEHVLAAIESGAGPATPAPSAPAAAPGTALPPPSRNGAAAAGAFSPPSGLLPLLFSALDEDWYTDLRLAACYVVEQLLELVGTGLSDACRRALYPELHKRLDDAHNTVRVAACGALRAFVTSAGPSYCDTNSGYLVAGVVIHMDDADVTVQEAACGVLLAVAALKPGVTATEVRKVRDRFRSKHYCDRVLMACEKVEAGKAAQMVMSS